MYRENKRESEISNITNVCHSFISVMPSPCAHGSLDIPTNDLISNDRNSDYLIADKFIDIQDNFLINEKKIVRHVCSMAFMVSTWHFIPLSLHFAVTIVKVQTKKLTAKWSEFIILAKLLWNLNDNSWPLWIIGFTFNHWNRIRWGDSSCVGPIKHVFHRRRAWACSAACAVRSWNWFRDYWCDTHGTISDTAHNKGPE